MSALRVEGTSASFWPNTFTHDTKQNVFYLNKDNQ